MGFCELDDEPLEVFSGVVGWGDGEDFVSDVEVEAFGAGEVGFEGVLGQVQGFDGAEAVGFGELHVVRVVEVEDVVAEGGGVEAPVALQGVTGLQIEQAVVAFSVVGFDFGEQFACVDVAFVQLCRKCRHDEIDKLHCLIVPSFEIFFSVNNFLVQGQ